MGVLTKKDLKVIKNEFMTIWFNGKSYSTIRAEGALKTNEYNENGLISKIITKRLTNNDRSELIYFYDEFDNIIRVDQKLFTGDLGLTYKNKNNTKTIASAKYFDDDHKTIKEAHFSEYDIEVELSKDNIYTYTKIYKNGTKEVQLIDKETKNIISIMYFIKDGDEYKKAQGIMYTYNSNNDNISRKITNIYDGTDIIMKSVEEYDSDGYMLCCTNTKGYEIISNQEIRYDFHPITKEQVISKHIIVDGDKVTEIEYEYLDNGKIARAYNSTTGEELKIGSLENGIYHFKDKSNNMEMFSSDDIDEVITNNELGKVYSYQFKNKNNANCSICKFSNDNVNEAIKSSILEYEFKDSDNLIQVQSYYKKDCFTTIITKYEDDTFEKVLSEEMITLQNDPQIHNEYFDKFIKFVEYDLDTF